MTNIDYLYDKDTAKDIFGKNYFVDKNLHFRIIERGTILPHKVINVNGKLIWDFGGIVDGKGNYIKESGIGSESGIPYTPTEQITYFPATVIYIGFFFNTWGHSITDNIRRLWFLRSEVFKEHFKNCPVVYIPWQNTGGSISRISKKFQTPVRNFGMRYDKVFTCCSSCAI